MANTHFTSPVEALSAYIPDLMVRDIHRLVRKLAADKTDWCENRVVVEGDAPVDAAEGAPVPSAWRQTTLPVAGSSAQSVPDFWPANSSSRPGLQLAEDQRGAEVHVAIDRVVTRS